MLAIQSAKHFLYTTEFPTISLMTQGSYASGKCQGNLNFFKVRELSGNFMWCQGKMNIFLNVREMSGNFIISILYQMMRNRK